MAWRGNKLRRSLIDGIDLIILFQALKAMFHLCTNLKLPFNFNCNIILYLSQVLPLGDITMIGAVRVSPKNMAHLVQSKFRDKKWNWKFFTKVIFTTIYSRIFLKEPCGLFELFNMLLVRQKKVFSFFFLNLSFSGSWWNFVGGTAPHHLWRPIIIF